MNLNLKLEIIHDSFSKKSGIWGTDIRRESIHLELTPCKVYIRNL